MRRTFRVRCIRPATQGTRALARGPSPGPRAGGAVLPLPRKEIVVSCVGTNDAQLARLADAIAQRVGQQRFHVWFNNSTRMDLRQDGLEIAVPNDFISEWIGKNFTRPIQEAAHEVLGGPLPVRFCVVPELFEVQDGNGNGNGVPAAPNKNKVGKAGVEAAAVARSVTIVPGAAGAALNAHIPMAISSSSSSSSSSASGPSLSVFSARPRLRHDLHTYVVGPSNQLAYNTSV